MFLKKIFSSLYSHFCLIFDNSPYVEIGQFYIAFYFAWLLVVVPVIGIVENTIMYVVTD